MEVIVKNPQMTDGWHVVMQEFSSRVSVFSGLLAAGKPW
jgi:hypothetical protein